MSPFEIVEQKLREGMVQGAMHACLRDIGRLAGGYLAAGKLSLRDVGALKAVACSLSKNKIEGARKWDEAVEFGRKDPVREERVTTGGTHWDFDSAVYVGRQEAAPAVIDANFVEDEEIQTPSKEAWKPVEDLVRYLELVFEPEEYVGLVTDAWQREGETKWLPAKGVADLTREELVEKLRKAKDPSYVIGDTVKGAGAWVRINPMDGKGVKDVNVTAFRHALIEADDQDLGRQLGLIRALQLPCSALVHSGGKSVHAIVRVDAPDATEYRARVNRLYEVCNANGLKVDEQCRNPSRLSRLPGVWRGERPQYLIDGKCGMASWEDWTKHIEEVNDELPDFQKVPATREALPPLAPEIIAGVLREGHKMRISGPSKAGKSFLLLELCIAMAEGKDWLGFPVKQGRSVYVNLELDHRSVFHRIHAVYEELGWDKDNIDKIDVWNLRGHTCPLDKLAPRLIRRASGGDYKAIIFDPIYKIQTGDENDPGDVAKFCNILDHVSVQLGAAVIDCHHHSKGLQGQKRAMDRASGSGVFGRDPDAIIDLIELDISRDRRDQLVTALATQHMGDLCAREGLDFEAIPLELRGPADKLLQGFRDTHPGYDVEAGNEVARAHAQAARMTGWRVEGSLREFAAFEPVRIWFDHPIHRPNVGDLLTDAKAAGEEPPWVAAQKEKAEAKREKNEAASEALEKAIEAAGGSGVATIKGVAESLGIDPDTVRNRIKKSTGWRYAKGLILEVEDED